jgi:hypothetical protein
MTAKRSLASLTSAFTSKTGTGGGNQNWKLFYPFWKIPVGSIAVVRFLPDLDSENSLGFLVENLTHELVINGERKTVPCLSMHGEHCPICELSREYYDEKSPKFNQALGKKYYKKKSYIGQVIVVESPIDHDQNQLVKLIEFGPKIFKQIQAAFQSGDLEEAPFELKGGYNFRIRKTQSGEYADYGQSSFAPKQSDLDDEVIGQLNLFDLKNYRGKDGVTKVDRETLEAMLIAEQTGAAFNGDSDEAPAPTPRVQAPVSAPKVEAPAPVESAPAAEQAAPSKTSSILDQLRARAKAAQSAE